MKRNLLFVLLIVFFQDSYAQESSVNNPIKNFESLWSEFDKRYANFELKKVDWDSVYNKYRPQINGRTNNRELFEICCSMLQELSDGHVTIIPNFDESDIELSLIHI